VGHGKLKTPALGHGPWPSAGVFSLLKFAL